ncbi:STAS/SEC14 domain-containing protein [Thermoleophilia bacterium SCSIO 60948]|nr:STAS/SEC14 domain-containing protein [Thermoleophilia bacterium SCSIO 60948]
MIEVIDGMPPGTMGFRCEDGDVRPIDLRNVMMPSIRRVVRARERLRILVVAGDGFEGVDRAAIWERAKHAWDLGDRDFDLLDRLAVATDVPWIRRGVGSFGWMAPGEVRVFELGEVTRAQRWVARD